MNDRTDDARARFRHEARTILNHVVGFGELLSGDAGMTADPAKSKALADIGKAAASLRQPVLEYVGSVIDGSGPSDALRGQVYERIYDLVSLVQAAKRDASRGDRFIGDVRKVHEAVNSLAALFDEAGPAAGKVAGESPAGGRSLEPAKAARSGRILVVDDDSFNREILARHLERQGHVVCQASNGREAFTILSEAPFEVVVLDIMMPGMSGFQFLEALREDPRLREVSTIVVSALDDPVSMARCIELGAEDYLIRDFDPILLKARIDSLLEKKEYKRQNDAALRRLVETQERLAAELRDAASYVRSLLPKRLRWRGVSADWEFIPSLSLGGDCFYYHRIDERRLAIYLLDVSGHGIQAALLSATIMNMLRGLALGGVDYGSPSSVLSRLNRSFRIEDQNNMYFTIWYGVYDAQARTLLYASAGSPPAILVGPDGAVSELVGDGPVIGVDEGASFSELEASVSPGSNLYLFSDGLFEIRTKAGGMLPWESFVELLEAHHLECTASPGCLSPIKRIVDSIRSLSSKALFDDDISIVELAFDE
ncbi:MAG TPA: SpoIIE family protein phosphatase [Spirochaetia bacterium]|nr:SpoIIE family protein phosphatase [Spirochaetaceae bacterium]HPE88598.1 SpoIIE family protein phosphatase [Spirochaetales bacterium]HRW23631.1 SpoIIE family protein phosphatase [Spirochaetia bacterium]